MPKLTALHAVTTSTLRRGEAITPVPTHTTSDHCSRRNSSRHPYEPITMQHLSCMLRPSWTLKGCMLTSPLVNSTTKCLDRNSPILRHHPTPLLRIPVCNGLNTTVPFCIWDAFM